MAAPKQSNPLSEIALAGFVIIAILILLLEMPNWVINFSISFNITLGIVLLMISLYVQKPLELAAFPSIILIGTINIFEIISIFKISVIKNNSFVNLPCRYFY